MINKANLSLLLSVMMLGASFGAGGPATHKSAEDSPSRASVDHSTDKRLATMRRLYSKGKPGMPHFEKLVKKLTLSQTVALIKELEASPMYRGFSDSYLVPLYRHWTNLDPAGVWRSLLQEKEELTEEQKPGWVERTAQVLGAWSCADASTALVEYINLTNHLIARPEMNGLKNYPSWQEGRYELFQNAASTLNDMPTQLQKVDDALIFGVGIGHWASFQMRSRAPQTVIEEMTRHMEAYVKIHSEDTVDYLRERAADHTVKAWFEVESKNAIEWYENIRGRELTYMLLDYFLTSDGSKWSTPVTARNFFKQNPNRITDFLLNSSISEAHFDLLLLIPNADQQLSVFMQASQKAERAEQVRIVKRVLSKSDLTKFQKAEVRKALESKQHN